MAREKYTSNFVCQQFGSEFSAPQRKQPKFCSRDCKNASQRKAHGIVDPNPSGVCQCGCGEDAPVVTVTHLKRGLVKGHHFRFVLGHHNRTDESLTDPNPSGLCMCGCGQETGLTRSPYGHHYRYVFGHNAIKPVASEEDYAVEDRGYESPCWTWRGDIDRNGYGLIYRGRARSVLAHRSYYIHYFGDIPEKMDVHHRCTQKDCVNPDHLQVVNRKDHLRLHRDMAKESAES